jgi:hypothetical protein
LINLSISMNLISSRDQIRKWWHQKINM